MNFLYSKEIPYFFTVLIGLIAYQTNRITEIQSDSPLLAYQFNVLESSQKGENKVKQMECELLNLSRKESIQNMTLHIKYKSDLPVPKIVRNPEIIAIAPSAIIADTLYSSGYGVNEYRIPTIQPNARYTLLLETETHPLIEENPKLYLSCDMSVRLVPTSLMTSIIGNQLLVNLVLLFTWVFFSIMYLIFFTKNKKTNLPDEKT